MGGRIVLVLALVGVGSAIGIASGCNSSSSAPPESDTGGGQGGGAAAGGGGHAGGGGTGVGGGGGVAGGGGGLAGGGGGGAGGGTGNDAGADGGCPGETDVGCGGSSCPPCEQGQHCLKSSDCDSSNGLVCSGFTDAGPGGTCVPQGCTDGVKDGTETDVDCGGLVCPACADGKKCQSGTDCIDKVCSQSTQTCSPATCTDGVKNGTETDVDCGGSCPPCTIGKGCLGAGDCTSSLCSTGTCACPGGMVAVATKIVQGGAFCIDATEVTKADYNKFLLANPPPTPATCAWKFTDAGNATYNPGNNWPPTLCPQNGAHEGTEPVQDVDWCDAYNYCAWSGKHLCGHLGASDTDAGVVFSNDFGAYGDPTQSAWYNACSQQGVSVYPYSGAFNPNNCNGAAGIGNGAVVQDFDCSGNPLLTSCQGGSSGLYQMSGNVAEWEDSCNGASAGAAAEGDLCYVRGGSFLSGAADLECTPGDGGAPPALSRNTQVDEVGFRCCVF